MDILRSTFHGKKGSKSYDATNGLVFNNILLPEEVVLLILSFVDCKSLPDSRLVCSKWNDLITCNHFWRVKLNRINRNFKENLPWYIHYCVVLGVFDTNLIKNGNGENKFKYWKITKNGGDKWKVENTPIGAAPLPENVPEFNGKSSCFVTSYGTCSKSQFIDLNNHTLLKKIITEFHPTILVSEWYAGRFDCGSVYKLNIRFYTKDQNPIYESEEMKIVEQWEGSVWNKVTIECDYPEEIASKIALIEFYHEGSDTQFWKGHFGSKMAGGVMKLLYDSL